MNEGHTRAAAHVASWAYIVSASLLALVAVSAPASAADIVHLSNGDILEGKIVEEGTPEEFKESDNDIVRSFIERDLRGARI